MERFVVLCKDKVYFVFDSEAWTYKMPEMAVSIYFSTYKAAQTVADAMNDEWAAFCRNPN